MKISWYELITQETPMHYKFANIKYKPPSTIGSHSVTKKTCLSNCQDSSRPLTSVGHKDNRRLGVA